MPVAPLNHMATTWWTYVAHASWQATVVGLLMVLVVRLSRRWSSPLRHWLLFVALAKFALPPMLFAPQGIFGFLEPPPAITALHPDAVLANWSAMQDVLAQPVTSQLSGRVPRGDATSSARAIARLRSISIWQELFGLLPLLHMLGGMTLALLIIRRVVHSAGPRGSGLPVEYGELHRRFLNIQTCLALRGKAQLRLCHESHIPTASGVFRPVVTISPALVKSLSPDELDWFSATSWPTIAAAIYWLAGSNSRCAARGGSTRSYGC